jgi:predicted AAA+ superfamily ATPase
LPHVYGKQVLRAQPKIYLADPAIAPSVLLKGKSLLEDQGALARAVESGVFKHLFTHYHARGALFSYWRGTRDLEVDIVAEIEGRIIPFEVKYQARPQTTLRDLKGLSDLVARRSVPIAYVLTRELSDFGLIAQAPVPILRIPAALACLWLGQIEFGRQDPTGFAER